jgi:hypothetical protein
MIIKYKVETIREASKRTNIPISKLLEAKKAMEAYRQKTGSQLLSKIIRAGKIKKAVLIS